jgi:transposase
LISESFDAEEPAMTEGDELEFWTSTLKLPDFRVVHVRRDTSSDPLTLTVVPTMPLGFCSGCCRATDCIHRTLDSRPIKDLSVGPQAVELIVRTYQFYCERCDRYFTPRYPALAEGAHATERFLELAARLIRFSDIANAAAFLGLPEKNLERWYYDYVERKNQESAANFKPIKSLGIDELSLKKRHRQFVAVFVDHTNERVLEVVEGRDKDLIVKYLRDNNNGLFAELEEVTTDMWDGYVNAAKEVFGQSFRVTIDRFHVVKNFQEQLNNARREIQRELDNEQAKELKGTRWLWTTNPENLTKEQQQQLEVLKEHFPRLKQLVEQRESLRAIFEDRSIQDAASGAKRLRDWVEQAKAIGLKALDRFCKTMSNWLELIANYFVSRSSNGRTEGFNHGLRAILWRAYGMLNFRHFRLRVLDRFGHPANA